MIGSSSAGSARARYRRKPFHAHQLLIQAGTNHSLFCASCPLQLHGGNAFNAHSESYGDFLDYIDSFHMDTLELTKRLRP